MNNYVKALKAFKLPEFWENKLQSNSSKKKNTALRTLEGMKEGASSVAIYNQTTTKKSNSRKHAKSVYMKFNSEDAFKFLEEDFDKDFNRLDKIRVHAALKERAKTRRLPALIRWVVNSKNENFQVFLIQEIGYFNQYKSCEALMNLFNTTSSQAIKMQIIDTIGVLRYKEAIPTLISEFDYATQNIRNQIINTMGLLGGNESLEFLEMAYHENHNSTTMVKILENIFLIELEQGNDMSVFNKLKSGYHSEFEKLTFSFIEEKYGQGTKTITSHYHKPNPKKNQTKLPNQKTKQKI